MIDRPRLERPTAGACCRCGAPIAGEEIFHWSPGSWSVWCRDCYKAEHLPNLVRLAETHRERNA
jgi:NMD protein affecting ribosome stability and mRNA decay